MTVAVATMRPAPVAARRRSAAPPCEACERGLEPFTVEHFERWSSSLVLDSGKQFRAETFQLDFVKDLFAGFDENWLILPEGNGKTTFVAQIALHHLEHRPVASVPIAASSREQAGMFYRQAVGFIHRSPVLRATFRPMRGYRQIRLVGYEEEEVEIQVYAADADTADGVIPTLAIIDELHRHKNLDLYNVWKGKLDKRHGQIIAISTAGEPSSEFEEARAGYKIDATAMTIGCYTRAATEASVIHDWSVPKDGDVEDMELVKGANPFSGVTVQSLTKKRRSPTMTLPHWKRINCNVATRAVASAISEVQWDSAQINEEIPVGMPVWVGIDGSRQLDTTAIVPMYVERNGRCVLGAATILEPPADGKGIRDAAIKAAIELIRSRNRISTVVVDPYELAGIIEWLRDDLGIEVIVREPNNPNACEDRERFMEALREERLCHTGDRALRQHVLNATTVEVLGRAKFERPVLSRRSQREQRRRVIDALDAAAMVHSCFIGGPSEERADTQRWGAA